MKFAVRAVLGLLFAGVVAMQGAAFAQDYPQKPIKLIIPFATSGFSDIAGRRVGQAISESLGVPVVIENKAGAGGLLGADAVAKAPADGYTLLLGSNGPMSVGPALYQKVPYDPVRDFEPIIMLGVSPITVVVHPSVPAKDVKQLVAYLKANPGKIPLASPGVGTSSHLAAELFQQMTGTRMVHVPYKGSGPAMTDLVGGQVLVAFDPLSSCLPFIKSGRLRALAVSTQMRAPALPDVPTLNESGVAGYEASTYAALLAPAATPKPILAKLNAVAAKSLQSPAMLESFSQFATVPVGGSPEHLAEYIRHDLARWTKVIKDGNIKVE